MSQIETKVQAASLAAAASGVVLWALQTYAFKGSAVPAGLVSLIDATVPAVLAGVAGYFAPHTPRPVPVTLSSQTASVLPPNLPPPAASDPGGTA